MPTWLWITLGSVLGLVLLYYLLLALTAGRSEAGIITSRLGRSLRVWDGMVRMFFRLVGRTLRRAFTPKAKRAALDARYHEETAQSALEAMGNMKGVLMKLGQIVSFMDETIPEAYQEQLRQLQSNAPPMGYDTVVRVVEAELGKPPERIFARFDREPLAAASIGQVHRAQLRDGTPVAVKIQYPGVDQAIAADLKNADMLIGIINAVTPSLDARPIAEELRERMLEELDYVQEAKNQETFLALFEHHPKVVVPRVFHDFTAKRVLTTQLVEGIGFYEFLENASQDQKREAVLTLREFVFDSIWFHHLFNGDPHPGNYLFMPDGRVAFLDFGSVKRFDPTFITNFKELNRYYLLGEKERYFDKALEMRFIKPGHEHKVDREWLWSYAHWFYAPILDDEPFAFTAEYCKQALSQLFGENMRKLNMPPDYLLLNRITFGLNSIMAKLGANENWRRLSLKYYFPDGLPAQLTSAPAPSEA